MQREDGVLAEVLPGGTEMRLHRFRRMGGEVMRRIPWHHDVTRDVWYSGVEGPEIKTEALKVFLGA
jgi:hypothetical protein